MWRRHWSRLPSRTLARCRRLLGAAVEALASRVHILLLGQRGTGRNAEPLPEPYNIAHVTADAIEAMVASGIARAHVMGHALGGLVGLELARRHPERIGRPMLVNAQAKADRHTERCSAYGLGILHAQGPVAYVAAQPLFLHAAPYLSANHEKAMPEIAHGPAYFQGKENLLRRIAALQAFDTGVDLPRISAPR